MYLYCLETGFARATSASRKLGDHMADAGLVEFTRHSIAFAEGHRRRSNNRPAAFALAQRALRLPTQCDAGLAASMSQLQGGYATLLTRQARDACQRLDLLIVPDAQIARGN